MGGALLVAFSAFWHPAAGFYFLLGGFENRNPELHAMLHATVTVAPYAEVARAPEREANTPQKMWAETQELWAELGSRYHARFAYNIPVRIRKVTGNGHHVEIRGPLGDTTLSKDRSGRPT